MNLDTDPPAPLPERGQQGEEGDEGTDEGIGGTGGQGGRGGRGGIGLTGLKGDTGKTGAKGPAGGPPGPRGRPGEDLDSKWNRRAVWLSVLITGLLAVYFATAAQNRLDEAETARANLITAQAGFDRQVACQQALIEATIEALKTRSAFAEQQAETTLQGDIALRKLQQVLTTEDPAAISAEARREYVQTLDIVIQAIREQLQVRDLSPYPTVDAVEACQ